MFGIRDRRGTRAGSRPAPVTSLVLAAAVLFAVATSLPPAAGAQSRDSVQVEVVAGFDGEVGDAMVFPLRATLTSDRAREVDVAVFVEGAERIYRTELVAGAPVDLDVALSPPPYDVTSFRVEVHVRAVDGGRLGQGSTEVVPRGDRTLVGVGPSLVGATVTSTERTVGGVQQAVLVPLDDAAWHRPGVLAAMSGVVLGAADLDQLGDQQRELLRSWVWQGGNLALDVPRTDPLPVVDLPAAAGLRTAVGAGWVRFTEGRAATGPWDRVLEPAAAPIPQEGGEVWFDGFGWLGLIDVSFLPTSTIIAAVFGTALVAGPALWFLLRSRARRRWMWVASPALSLSVAAALLAMGQGVFTRAEARATGDVVASPWESSGNVVFGLKQSQDLRVPADAEVIDASPRALVVDAGDERTVRVDLPRNGFGYLGLSQVPLEQGPRIEVTAVARGDDTAEVTVTNHSDGTLREVVVRTGSRARPFEDVPPGASVTLPFLVNAEIAPLDAMFSSPELGPVWERLPGGRARPLPMTRGLVVVTGTIDDAEVSAAGLGGRGPIGVRAFAPVTAERPDPAALRIETVGVPPGAGGPGDDFVEDGFATTTTVPEPQEPQATDGPFRSHVRITSAHGRPASPCGVQSAVGQVEVWDGARWVPATRAGDRYTSERYVAQGQMQGWALPAIEPGGALYLRLTSRLLLRHPPLLFDCGGAA